MRVSLWLLNRLGAAITGAVLVGIAAGTAMFIIGNAQKPCVPECTHIFHHHYVSLCVVYGSTCGNLGADFLFVIAWTTIWSVALGTIPGWSALTITPAKNYPWRALPILVVATLLGFGAWAVVGASSRPFAPWLASLFLLPTISGLVVASSLNRLPPLLRLNAKSE